MSYPNYSRLQPGRRGNSGLTASRCRSACEAALFERCGFVNNRTSISFPGAGTAAPSLVAALARGVFVLLLLFMAVLPTPGHCQSAGAGRSFALIGTEWQRTLNAVEKYLENPQPAAEQRQRYDTLLSSIAQDAQAI